jgi:integrase
VRRKGVGLTSKLKTESSHRTVPLGKVVVDVLAEHLAWWPAHPTLWCSPTSAGHIQQHPFSQLGRTLGRRRSCPGWVNGPHQLRHHFASLLIARGASVKVEQRRLGHASAKTTLDIYGHMVPDEEGATRAAIDDELGAALADEKPAADPGHDAAAS